MPRAKKSFGLVHVARDQFELHIYRPKSRIDLDLSQKEVLELRDLCNHWLPAEAPQFPEALGNPNEEISGPPEGPGFATPEPDETTDPTKDPDLKEGEPLDV